MTFFSITSSKAYMKAPSISSPFRAPLFCTGSTTSSCGFTPTPRKRTHHLCSTSTSFVFRIYGLVFEIWILLPFKLLYSTVPTQSDSWKSLLNVTFYNINLLINFSDVTIFAKEFQGSLLQNNSNREVPQENLIYPSIFYLREYWNCLTLRMKTYMSQEQNKRYVLKLFISLLNIHLFGNETTTWSICRPLYSIVLVFPEVIVSSKSKFVISFCWGLASVPSTNVETSITGNSSNYYGEV